MDIFSPRQAYFLIPVHKILVRKTLVCKMPVHKIPVMMKEKEITQILLQSSVSMTVLCLGLCVTCRPVCYVIVVTFQRESIGQCD